MSNKISFVVAIYNVGVFLDQCIQSLINQTYKNIEIILVNDGSSDNSLEICHKYANKDQRIKIIDQKNQGANSARNHGLNSATGDWVFFVDGDDYVEENICKSLLSFVDEDIDFIIFTYNCIRNNKIKKIKSFNNTILIGNDDFRNLQLAALNRLGKYPFNYKVLDSVSIWNKLYSMNFLKKHNIKFVEGMPKLQDLTFNLQVYEKAKKALYINQIGYFYRINNLSLCHRYQEDMIEKFNIINSWIEKFCFEKQEEAFTKAYYERVLTHIRTCIVLYLCNVNNKKKYMIRKQEFKELCQIEPYKTAIKEVKIFAYFGIQEKILTFFIKTKCFIMCDLLCLLKSTFRI